MKMNFESCMEIFKKYDKEVYQLCLSNGERRMNLSELQKYAEILILRNRENNA